MDKTLHDKNIFHFIYLILEREFLTTNKKIYKLGKTTQENMARFKSYPNCSILLFHCICSDCHKIEKILINNFKQNFIWRSDIGFEYFEGEYTQMIENIFYEICSFNIKKKEEEIILSKKSTLSFDSFNFVTPLENKNIDVMSNFECEKRNILGIENIHWCSTKQNKNKNQNKISNLKLLDFELSIDS